jgi:hypothetical protein
MLRTSTAAALFATAVSAFSSGALAREPVSGAYTCHLGSHWVGVTLDTGARTMAVDEERWWGAAVVGRNKLEGTALRYEDEGWTAYELPMDYGTAYYLWFPKHFDQVAFTFCWDCAPYVCE